MRTLVKPMRAAAGSTNSKPVASATASKTDATRIQIPQNADAIRQGAGDDQLWRTMCGAEWWMPHESLCASEMIKLWRAEAALAISVDHALLKKFPQPLAALRAVERHQKIVGE